MAPNSRVLLSGQPVVTLASPYGVVGCSLAGTGAPPCVTAQFMVGATRVMVDGVPVATLAGSARLHAQQHAADADGRADARAGYLRG